MNKDKDFQEAYKTAISARNFHFNNFSKWMTYYYVAVAAIFVALYSPKTDDIRLQVGLSLLGFIVSILWHLSCKGYYFWIKNWTYQIKRFEDNMKNKHKVYSVFSEHVKEKENNLYDPIQSANISTSKVTLILSFIVSLGWAYISTFFLSHFIGISNINCCIVFLISIFLTYCLIIIAGTFLTSNLEKHKLL